MIKLFNGIFCRSIYFTLGFLIHLTFFPVEAFGWSCTGFFINYNGYIATADHCIRGGKHFKVFYKGKYYPARVIGEKRFADVAILKIDVTDSVPLNLSTSIRESVPLAIIGHPLGVNELIMTTGTGYRLRLLRTGISMHIHACSGSSGSPVINRNGQAVGILTEGVADFSMHGECSEISYGPVIQHLIDLLDEKNIFYYKYINTSVYTWRQIYIQTSDNDSIVQFYGEK